MNTQSINNYSTITKPHNFYCRQDSLGLSEEDCCATEGFRIEGEPLFLENQGGDFFNFELDQKVEQRTNTTLGNLLEVPDYKFGNSTPQVSGEDELKQSGSLDDYLGDFSILEDELSTSFDSEGEKSKPKVKVRTVLEESAFMQEDVSEIFAESFHYGNQHNQPRNSFKRKLNLAISGFKQSPTTHPLGKEFELDSTAPNTRKGSKDSFNNSGIKNRITSKNSHKSSSAIKKRIKKRRKHSSNSTRTSHKSIFNFGLDINELSKSMLKSKIMNQDAGLTCSKLQKGIEGMFQKAVEKEQKYHQRVEEIRLKKLDSLLMF